MKLSQKISTLFMIAMIFIASTGMTLNLHFCSDNLKQVSMQPNNNHDCCKKTADQKQENKKECSKHKGCESKQAEKSGKPCCKDAKIKAEVPVKADSSSVKKENSFAQSMVFLKSYVLSFLSFETEDNDKEEKPDQSLFPLLKEGLYILLNQFRN